VARIILGLGTGGIIATVSVWQSELSKAESRGSHVSAFGIFCGTGIAVALWIDFGFSFAPGSVSWRVPLALSGILSIIPMIGILMLPESPRWLMKKGRMDEAREILMLLNPTEPETVEKEIRDIEIALHMGGTGSWGAMFSMGPQRILHRVVLACAAQMFLQMSGISMITYYASSIYETDLGFKTRESQILAAASQFAVILGACMCSFTVDRFGRRSKFDDEFRFSSSDKMFADTSHRSH